MRRLLRLEDDVEVIDDVGSGREAVEAIQRDRPDLVLLDVQMPDLDGFGVVDALGIDQMPPTIFVTAFNEYAVRAFDVHAIDYLLKPFDTDRFRAAFVRARVHLEQRSSAEQGRKIRALLEQVLGEGAVASVDRSPASNGTAAAAPPAPRHRYVDRLMVKHDGRVFFVKATDVDWFEASGNYVRIHTGKVSHLIRETMQRVEAQLDPSMFVRIHRAVIVNLDRIRELQPWFAGDYVVILRDGRQLKLSRTYREHLHTRMQRLA
ncbi:MAG: response regulator transcription factor [Gemmatimonadetes bacterium]|nr:response regulator transcription factor [Gemmatimonadota bacterium]